MLPNSLKNLIDNFKMLPGIGGKTAERLAFAMIDFDKNNLTSFSEAVLDVRDKVTYCKRCGKLCYMDKIGNWFEMGDKK